MALVLLAALGCQCCQSMMGARDPFGPRASCALPPQSSTAEIVAYVNQNTARIHSWRTYNAKISAKGQPVSVGASIAVEAPRNFRLIAKSPLGEEVDLGSNARHYWFWNRHDESKRIYLASHEVTTVPEAGLSMPFQPEWVMEAMGVIALDPQRVRELRRDPQARTVTLVEDRTSPQGQPVRKVTVVDLCHGLVREHALVDQNGSLIARAELSGHVRDKATQAVVPAKINLQWPIAQMDMTMSLGSIEVNPTAIPTSTFAVQQYTGYHVHQVGGGPQDDTGTDDGFSDQ